MEDNNIKLNNISLPPVPEDIPRKADGTIDIEAVSIGRDYKGYIIPDDIFNKYLKEGYILINSAKFSFIFVVNFTIDGIPKLIVVPFLGIPSFCLNMLNSSLEICKLSVFT